MKNLKNATNLEKNSSSVSQAERERKRRREREGGRERGDRNS